MRLLNHRYWLFNLVVTLSIAMILSERSAFADGAIFDFQTGQRATRMWVPSALPSVRGIIIYGNGAGGDDRHHINDQTLRGVARHFGFVIIATAYWANMHAREIGLWDTHLQALADLSGYPELINAPWVALGLSNGGQMAYGFNVFCPEKVIGFAINKGGYYCDPYPSQESLETPGILISGELDAEFRRRNIQGLFLTNRSRGARWAWVEEQAMGHEGDADRLLVPYLSECIEVRYPHDQIPTATTTVTLKFLPEDEGWLIDPSTWDNDLTTIAPYRLYLSERAKAGWVPNRACAFLYRAFATRTDWIELSAPGFISDRPFYIEIPGFGDYWDRPPGIAPCHQTIIIDTREYPMWTLVRIYANDLLLAQVPSGVFPKTSASLTILLGPGVYGLSGLVTGADGRTRTTGLRHRSVIMPLTHSLEDGPQSGTTSN